MKTKNINFCAFLKLYNINPIQVNKLTPGKAEYVYDLKETEWEKWQIKFNSSEFVTYAANLNAIKDLAY